jgi:hypothetical protein
MDINSFALGYSAGKKGGGGMKGFHMVRFFNDDRTTLLYTVFVPTGANAMYAGETPVSTGGGFVFRGFEPTPVNVTADMDCYAFYDAVGTLEETPWSKISELSANDEAQNYFSIGDTKTIHIEGTVGTLEVNDNYDVYILGFNHNEEQEGKGIHFRTFRKGMSICLTDDSYGATATNGAMIFNLQHWGNWTYGGWRGYDLRYDILGSTDVPPSGYGSAAKEDRIGYDATETCATNPVPNTLMDSLPSDLRAVMKPMTKYADCGGGGSNSEAKVVATVDYLPLIAEFEIAGKRTYANQYEQTKQQQYAYYADGRSKIKYNMKENPAVWYTRSNYYYSSKTKVCTVFTNGNTDSNDAQVSRGIAPIFKV